MKRIKIKCQYVWLFTLIAIYLHVRIAMSIKYPLNKKFNKPLACFLGTVKPITINSVREPVSRLLSLYFYMR